VKQKDLFRITTGYFSNIAAAVITYLQAVDNFFIWDDGVEAPPRRSCAKGERIAHDRTIG
jgi:hypothetical protein